MVRPTSTQIGPKLTVRQRQVLGLIVDASAADGRPPTLREIGRRLGIASTNGVRDHLQALIEKGYIRRDERSARGIHVLRIPDGAPASAADGGRTSAALASTIRPSTCSCRTVSLGPICVEVGRTIRNTAH
jgi:repressor LexA